MNSKRKSYIGIIVFVLAVVATLVFLLDKAQTPDRPESIPETTLVYRLKWLANAGFIGDLYADTYGYFLREKLKVAVKPGGPEHDAIRELQTGSAAFGVASADQVIEAIEKGADVVVVAQIYRKNPVQWIYRATGGQRIAQPSDLRSKRVGVAIGDNDEAIMHTILRKNNIDKRELELVGIKYDFTPFTAKRVDLFPVYKNTQGVELSAQLKNAGEEVGFFDPETAGVTFVANSIVTTSRMVQDNPDLVARFVRAALKGWEDSLLSENEERSMRALDRFAPLPASGPSREANVRILQEQLIATRDLVWPSKQIPIGAIDVPAWEQTEQIMLNAGAIKRPAGIKGHLNTKFAVGGAKKE